MAIRRHGRSPFYQEIKEWTWSVDRLELGLLVSEESGTRCFSWVLLSCPHSKNKKHQGLLSAFIPSPHIMVTLQPGLLKIRGLQFPVNELLTPRKMSIGIGQMQTKSGRLMMTATTNVLDLQASKFKESWSVSVSVSVSLSLFLYIYNISLSLSLYLSISISLSIYQSIYISICLSLSLSAIMIIHITANSTSTTVYLHPDDFWNDGRCVFFVIHGWYIQWTLPFGNLVCKPH